MKVQLSMVRCYECKHAEKHQNDVICRNKESYRYGQELPETLYCRFGERKKEQ